MNMKQTRLDAYFPPTRIPFTTASRTSPSSIQSFRSVFIYDPMHRIAFFTHAPLETDQFIAERCQRTPHPVRLYLRMTSSIDIAPEPLPILNACDHSIPLLKSNLQKAIRRKHLDVAWPTALALFQHDTTEFIRRLPIICIEDVQYIPSIAIVVWWMMADGAYSFTTYDGWMMLQIIQELCECDEVFPYDSSTWDREELSKTPPLYPDDPEAVYVLYYRWLYGGMKGDRCLLYTAMEYYRDQPLQTSKSDSIHLPSIAEMKWEVQILEEAIDFHPYPRMLTLLEHWTSISKDRLREVIWFVDSAINVRKPITFARRDAFQDTKEWKTIEPIMDRIRLMMIS